MTARARAKPADMTAPTAPSAAYDRDFAAWCADQSDRLRRGDLGALDLAHLAEEIADLGNEQLHAIQSQYRRLIIHLLKWQFQPQRRSRSWEVSIANARQELEDREGNNPSLAARAGDIVARVYPGAVRLAALETRLPRDTFPAECPYTLAQLSDQDWLPEAN